MGRLSCCEDLLSSTRAQRTALDPRLGVGAALGSLPMPIRFDSLFLQRRVSFTIALASAITVSRAVDFLPLDLTAVSRAADLVTSSRALHKIRQCTVTREAMRLDLSCSEGGIQPCWRVIQPCCFDRNLCLNPTDTSRIQPSKHTSA